MTPAQLKRARKNLNMTQEAMAQALGFFGGITIYKMETGRSVITERTAQSVSLLLRANGLVLAPETKGGKK